MPGDAIDGRLVEGQPGGVQVRLAEQGLAVGVAAGVPGADGVVEVDGVGPLVGVLVAQRALLAVAVEGATDAGTLGGGLPAVGA